MVALRGKTFDDECGAFHGVVGGVAGGDAFLDGEVEPDFGYGECHRGRFGEAVEAAPAQFDIAVVEAPDLDARCGVGFAVERAGDERCLGLSPLPRFHEQAYHHCCNGEEDYIELGGMEEGGQGG